MWVTADTPFVVETAPEVFQQRRTVAITVEREPDAHLIAAAPDLYKSLRDVLSYPIPEVPQTIAMQAVEALAKAEGR